MSNRGSALFMVLSTMTALLIAVMAMYFSVVSSRSVQYAVFNQNQSYQSAVSIQDALVNWMSANSSSELAKKMMALDEGKTLTTNGNDFLAFNPSGTNDEENQVGAYDVNITKVKPETIGGVTCTTFDVATTVSVGGVKETIHIYWHIPPTKTQDSKVNSDIFASTGYVPNNADVASGKFNTKSVFDNEFVNFGNGSTEYKLYGDIYCGGSASMYDAKTVDLSKASTFVVRDSLYLYRADNLTLGVGSEKGKLYVGGDLYINNTFKLSKFDVYVIGNVYVSNSGSVLADSGCKLHVDGNYYIEGYAPDGGIFSRGTKLNGKVYVNGTESTSLRCDTWADDEVDAAVDFINTSTENSEFGNWKIEDHFPSTPQKIKFNSKAGEYEKELSFVSAGDKTWYGSIGSISDEDLANPVRNYTIFIDTGEDEENKYYLRVNANYDSDGDDIDDTFCWNPLGLKTTNNETDMGVNILVKGRGSLIIDIPDGVRYATSTYERFMHYGWFVLLGGSTNPNGGYSIKARNMMDSPVNPVKFIHSECPDGCCTYDVQTLTTKCTKCGTYQKEVSCDRHNYHRTFCPNTDCELNINEPHKNDEGKYTALCANRIDRALVDSYLNSNPTLKDKYPKDLSGDIIYPNCNIFLVSCDESAAIYLADYPIVDSSGKQKGCELIESSTFFGFVYAPYMTYGGYHESETNSLRFCGGMVVSDYIFNDNSWYLNCYPDYMPSELGASGSLPHDAKAWKIIVGRN